MFVHALIRAGRSADTKLSLLKDITTKTRKTAGLGPENIWVYIQDIPAEQMVEFGRVLPEPGGEEEWCRGISTKKIRELSDAGALG
jgi:phenylpyruvate tautomerase PptA (4-oxalocrotonate tautomerase family)